MTADTLLHGVAAVSQLDLDRNSSQGSRHRHRRATRPGEPKPPRAEDARQRDGGGQLKARVQATHRRSRGTYGAPRIHAELAAGGVAVSRERVVGCQHTSPAFGARCRERGIARSMIQWIKRLGRGCRNRERFRNASYFHLGGLNLRPDAPGTHTKS